MCAVHLASWHFGVDLIDRESLRVDNLSILCILGNWSNCWSRANFLIYLAGTCPVVYTHCVVHPLIIWLVRSGSRKAESQRNFMFCSSNYIECKSLLSFRFCHTVCLWAEHKHIQKCPLTLLDQHWTSKPCSPIPSPSIDDKIDDVNPSVSQDQRTFSTLASGWDG